MNQRYCILNPNGGPITIRISANNALRASGNFSIQTKSLDNWQVTEQWQQAAGDTGSSDHTVQTAPAALEGKAFAGLINCCALLANADMGAVEIQVLQNGVSLPLTKPMHWNLTGVPNCNSGNAQQFNTSLIFLTHQP